MADSSVVQTLEIKWQDGLVHQWLIHLLLGHGMGIFTENGNGIWV